MALSSSAFGALWFLLGCLAAASAAASLAASLLPWEGPRGSRGSGGSPVLHLPLTFCDLFPPPLVPRGDLFGKRRQGFEREESIKFEL